MNTDMPSITLEEAYEVLGVSTSSSEEEVKRAYKKLALRTHPDKNPNDPEASKKFLRVSESYKRITDPDSFKDDGDDDMPSEEEMAAMFNMMFAEMMGFGGMDGFGPGGRGSAPDPFAAGMMSDFLEAMMMEEDGEEQDSDDGSSYPGMDEEMEMLAELMFGGGGGVGRGSRGGGRAGAASKARKGGGNRSWGHKESIPTSGGRSRGAAGRKHKSGRDSYDESDDACSDVFYKAAGGGMGGMPFSTIDPEDMLGAMMMEEMLRSSSAAGPGTRGVSERGSGKGKGAWGGRVNKGDKKSAGRGYANKSASDRIPPNDDENDDDVWETESSGNDQAEQKATSAAHDGSGSRHRSGDPQMSKSGLDLREFLQSPSNYLDDDDDSEDEDDEEEEDALMMEAMMEQMARQLGLGGGVSAAHGSRRNAGAGRAGGHKAFATAGRNGHRGYAAAGAAGAMRFTESMINFLEEEGDMHPLRGAKKARSKGGGQKNKSKKSSTDDAGRRPDVVEKAELTANQRNSSSSPNNTGYTGSKGGIGQSEQTRPTAAPTPVVVASASTVDAGVTARGGGREGIQGFTVGDKVLVQNK